VGTRLGQAPELEVTFLGRPRLQAEIRAAGGLRARSLEGAESHLPEPAYVVDSAELLDCDVILVCVKGRHTRSAGVELAALFADRASLPPVVSLQNGVRNAEVLRDELPEAEVLPGVVGFNVVARGEGVFHHTTQGAIQIERGPGSERLLAALLGVGLPAEVHDDMLSRQWTKLVVNLNNAVSALSDASIRDMILNAGYRRLVARVVAEGIGVLAGAQVPTSSFQGIPLRLFPWLLRLPTPLVRLVTRAQLRLDPQARSSMWQDLDQRRDTEVDYLNGEIVRIADEHGLPAPLNRRLVELVHEAEEASQGSPALSPEQLALALGLR
jgi:2-dehydropantoate 2-reductase